MTEQRCLGFSKSTIKRCSRLLGDDRLNEDRLTCITHTSQEGIAQRYKGDHDDNKALVLHHLIEQGFVPIDTSRPTSRDTTETDGRRQTNTQIPEPRTDTAGEIAKPSVDANDDPDDLAQLRPARLISGERQNGKSWNVWGNTDKPEAFSGDEYQSYLAQFKDGYKKKALNAGAHNARIIGGILSPLAALIAAMLAGVHFILIGFGSQPISADIQSLTSLAIVALLLVFVFLMAFTGIVRHRDRQRLNAHDTRCMAYWKHKEELKLIGANKQDFDKSIEKYKTRLKQGVSSSKIHSYIRRLKLEEEVATDKFAILSWLWLALARFWHNNIPPKTAAEKFDGDGFDNPAESLFLDSTKSGEEKILGLEKLSAQYNENEAKIKELKNILAKEKNVIKLNEKVNTEQRAFNSDNGFDLLLDVFFRPRALAFVTLAFCATALVKATISQTPHFFGPAYCESKKSYSWASLAALIGPNCYHVEIRRPGARTKTSKLFEPAIFHGKIDDKILISMLSENSSRSWFEWPSWGPRFEVPAASVIAMQVYAGEGYYNRIAMAPVSPPPAPQLTLQQQNHFNSITASSTASASQQPGESPKTPGVVVRNNFHTEEKTNLSVSTNFEGAKHVKGGDNLSLSAKFFFDDKQITLVHPDSNDKPNGNQRHFLVPFFLDPIKSPKHDEKFWNVYAGKIDTELDAFIAGFQSFKDPDFKLETANHGVASEDWPKAYVSTIKRILNKCGPPTEKRPPTESKIVVNVAGYASEQPFVDENDKHLPLNKPMLHALAEGRRAAVLAQLVDIPPKQTRIVDSKSKNPWTGIGRLIRALKETDEDALMRELASEAKRENLLKILKAQVYRFADQEDMRIHLSDWTFNDENTSKSERRLQGSSKPRSKPIEEAFQRSVVISISEEQLQECTKPEATSKIAETLPSPTPKTVTSAAPAE